MGLSSLLLSFLCAYCPLGESRVQKLITKFLLCQSDARDYKAQENLVHIFKMSFFIIFNYNVPKES